MIGIPFSGSKRYSYRYVREIVEAAGYKTVYEPFGGSCILSVNLLNDGLVGRAVVNDYDRFFDLYPDYLDLKDKVVEEGYRRGLKRRCHNSSGNYLVNPDGTKVKIRTRTLYGKERETIQDIISELVPKKFWGYFALGSNFTHSAVGVHEEVKLKDFAYFSSYLKTDRQRHYLSVLNRCEMNHLDWRDFIDKYEFTEDDILILDPPYIDTEQVQYKGKFTLDETFELIDRVNDLPCDYIFFNHDIEKVREWLKDVDCESKTIQHTGNKNQSANRKRFDVMAYIKK